MIIIVDNYDSFVWNLYQLVGKMVPEIRVVRNDEYSVDQIISMEPEAILLSPGPGRPEDSGICLDLVRHNYAIPIFGVCLGHQTICQALGGTISYAKKLMHGKVSTIEIDPKSRLFQGIKSPIHVARYHSLAAVRENLPKELLVTAQSDDGEVMAVEHCTRPLFGVQFHPESILTENGDFIIRNFLNQIKITQKIEVRQ